MITENAVSKLNLDCLLKARPRTKALNVQASWGQNKWGAEKIDQHNFMAKLPFLHQISCL